MKHIDRRDVLRGGGVAALAAGVAALPFVANASDDPLLGLLNRYLAEEAWFDSFHADLDEGRHELGWDEVNTLLETELDKHHSRCDAMYRAMVRLPAGAASSIVILNLISEQIEEGEASGGLSPRTHEVGAGVYRFDGSAVMKRTREALDLSDKLDRLSKIAAAVAASIAFLGEREDIDRAGFETIAWELVRELSDLAEGILDPQEEEQSEPVA